MMSHHVVRFRCAGFVTFAISLGALGQISESSDSSADQQSATVSTSFRDFLKSGDSTDPNQSWSAYFNRLLASDAHRPPIGLHAVKGQNVYPAATDEPEVSPPGRKSDRSSPNDSFFFGINSMYDGPSGLRGAATDRTNTFSSWFPNNPWTDPTSSWFAKMGEVKGVGTWVLRVATWCDKNVIFVRIYHPPV